MKARLALLLTASLLASLSCTPKTPSATAAQTGGSMNTDARSGFCILNGLALYDQPSEGTLKWKGTLTLGEKLSLLDQTTKAAEPGGSTQREFSKVRTEAGTEGWMRSDFLIPDSMLAVTTGEDAVIYTQPKNTAATAETIPVLTILAVSKETAGQTFLKVTFFNKMLKASVYIRNEGVSTRTPDVQSAILLYLAKQADKDSLRKTFLESARKDYPDSVFLSQIDSALSLSADPTAGREVEDFTESFLVNDNDVNVRSKPHEDAAKVGKLMKGQAVEATQKTTAEYQIGNASAPWFRIKAPEGWVWGGFLDPNQG